jgi:hypothetical protein
MLLRYETLEGQPGEYANCSGWVRHSPTYIGGRNKM